MISLIMQFHYKSPRSPGFINQMSIMIHWDDNDEDNDYKIIHVSKNLRKAIALFFFLVLWVYTAASLSQQLIILILYAATQES